MISICAFYSNKFQYRAAYNRIKRQIEKNTNIEQVFFYNEEKLFDILESKYPNIKDEIFLEKNKKGFSFWVWKPIIILETLRIMPENSKLLYIDIGCNLNNNEFKWKQIESRLQKHKLITAYAFGHSFRQYGESEYRWAKPEIFNELKINKKDQLSPQYQATWIMMINDGFNREFVKKWTEYCTNDNLWLVRPESKIISKISGLIESKHDQAVFSCLLKKKKITPLVANKSEMQLIQAARNLSLFSSSKNNLLISKIRFFERNIIKLLNLIFIS